MSRLQLARLANNYDSSASLSKVGAGVIKNEMTRSDFRL